MMQAMASMKGKVQIKKNSRLCTREQMSTKVFSIITFSSLIKEGKKAGILKRYLIPHSTSQITSNQNVTTL